jgi:hypothetical protein
MLAHQLMSLLLQLALWLRLSCMLLLLSLLTL